MNLAQTYHDYRISAINKSDVRKLIKEKLAQLIKDYGQKIETESEIESLSYLVNRVDELIKLKYKYYTWGEIELAIDRGKVGQYSKNTITSSKVTVQKVESWLFNFSEERSRNRISEQKNKLPNIDKSKQAPPEYGEALSWKIKNLSKYPELWKRYNINRVVAHIRENTIKELTEQINQEKEQYEPVHSVLSGKSNRKKSYSAAR